MAGYMLPIAIVTKAHSPTATTGSTHPRRQMLMISRITAAMEISIRSLIAGSWALTSV